MFNGKKRILAFCIALLVLSLVGVMFYMRHSPQLQHALYTTQLQATQGASTSTASQEQTPSEREVPSGLTEYRTQPYHFSILYPSDLTKFQDGDTPGNPLTVVLADKAVSKALQIYVQPYNLPEVTKERFKLDAPYPSFTTPTKVQVAGSDGLMFVGHGATVGDMLEIWFIRQGLLYEVTAPKAQEAWAENIIGTWEFIQ